MLKIILTLYHELAQLATAKGKNHKDMSDTYNLQRFEDAQKIAYNGALQEITSGLKTGHWIWYIFPQLKGFGRSYNSEYYGITNFEEASLYASHTILGARLREITASLLKVLNADNAPTIQDIVGFTDSRKIKSCMTLFECVTDEPLFAEVLEKAFQGKRDQNTIKALSRH